MSDCTEKAANAVSATLTESERHRLIRAERRRITLEVLAGRTTPIDLDDVAVQVAAREPDTPSSGERTRDRVLLSLHHKHLPIMDEIGVLDYDPETCRMDPCRDVIERLTA